MIFTNKSNRTVEYVLDIGISLQQVAGNASATAVKSFCPGHRCLHATVQPGRSKN